MPRRNKGSVPSLVHHKPSGRARVRIHGRDHWLGKWGSPEAQLAYNRLIAEYLATGRIENARSQPVSEPAAEAVVSSNVRALHRGWLSSRQLAAACRLWAGVLAEAR